MKRSASPVVILLIVTLLPAASLSSCNWITQKVAAMKPEIRSVSHQWGQVTEDTTELVTVVQVFNPNPFSLPIKEIKGKVKIADIEIGQASSQDIYVGKSGEFPVTILTRIDNSKMPDLWVAHLNNQEKSTLEINTDIVFDLKVSDFTFPYQLNQPLETDILSLLRQDEPIVIDEDSGLPLPADLDALRVVIKSSSASWGDVTREDTSINLSTLIQNDNPYPLVIDRLAYNSTVNEVVLASGETDIDLILMPATEGTINTSILLDNSNLITSFIKHIQNGETSTYQIALSLFYTLPGGEGMVIPIFLESQQFETDILGNKASS